MKKLRYCFLCLMILGTSVSEATHIVGGELNYECLGNDLYRISLTVFRDCYNGVPVFDNPAAIGVFDTLGNLVADMRIPYSGDDTLFQVLSDSCLVIPPEVCVHRTTYVDTVTLPFLAGGYELAYQRCCRNYTISNILNPQSTGATYYTFISEEALLACNDNPVFNAWPPIYICANSPINFDHSATDNNADSLVYELCAPFNGGSSANPIPQPPFPPPYLPVNWAPPFNINDMLGGIPLAIDRNTGLLTGTPNIVGQFVVGICVKEYKNGIVISETKRDFQYNVGVCLGESVANFDTPNSCDTKTIEFNNTGRGGSYFWDFGDPTTNLDTSYSENPTYTYPSNGNYTVTLIAGLGTDCADTLVQQITVQDQSIEWGIDLEYDPCRAPFTLNYTDASIDTFSNIIEWQWVISGGFNDTASSGSYTFPSNVASTLIVGLLVKNTNGCTAFGLDTIEINPIDVSYMVSDQFCRGSIVNIDVTNNNPADTLTYNWLPDPTIISATNTSSLEVTPVVPTTYWVEISSHDGCVLLDSVTVQTSTVGPLVSVQVVPDSIYPGQAADLFATQGFGYTYEWSPSATLSDSSSYNPKANPMENTLYTVTVTDETGCSSVDSAWVIVRDFLCDEPYIFIPNAFTPNGNGKNDVLYVRGFGIENMYLAVYNRWGQKVFETRNPKNGWNGTFNGMELPPDVFGYYLEVECIGGERFYKKGNVTLIR